MDLVADMLHEQLTANYGSEFSCTRLRPHMRCRAQRFPLLGRRHFAWTADRLAGRFVDYPRWLRNQAGDFDLFHIIDHSYSQLVHELPPGRTVVTCHDLDTFRSVLEPSQEHRSYLFRLMTGRILKGFTRAAHIICDSETIRARVLHYGLLTPDRITVAPNGPHPTCSPVPDPEADKEAQDILRDDSHNPLYLLHVGSTIPRKRIDVLLRVFAAVREIYPEAHLVRVGGAFTNNQVRLINELGLRDGIVVAPFLTRRVLAAIYRKSTLLLLTSDSEGFGLPVVEAMACGCPVVASDLPVLHEVGANAAAYVPVGDVAAWTGTILDLLRQWRTSPVDWTSRCRRCILQASRFSWEQHAHKTAEAYRAVWRRWQFDADRNLA